MLTMCPKQRVLWAPDRTRQQALRGVFCHQASRSMWFLDIRSLRSFQSLVPSNFDDLFEIFWLRRNSDQPQYVRIACPLLKMMFNSFVCQKPLQSRILSGTQTKTPSQSKARHPHGNGQARRRPVEQPRSNTRIYLDFVFTVLHLQLRAKVGCLSSW